MRVVFAGTPEFARIALDAILAAGHEVPLVLTQPDRPSGRGLKLTPSPVKQAALQAGIPVQQPRSLRLDGKYPEDAQAAKAALIEARPDVMVVAAYGLILPLWTLTLPSAGCLNIHASLLPRWRGAAPIQRAIEAGDAETGITIMQMDEGLDTGDMLLVKSIPISATHTAAQLHDALAELGGQCIVEALHALSQQSLAPVPQPEAGVCYAAKLNKAEAALDLAQPAVVLARRVRAFDPVPGATLQLPGWEAPIKVWAAQAVPAAKALEPGAIVAASEAGLDVATSDGVLRILQVQKPGGKRQDIGAFLRGSPQIVSP
ncbi:methionyl-tRNA formyltransferase [Pusillimonas sp. NJUB218]|uniref:methionyl-tRNA formyltransferase n=1 Tax=Pusillimonas sp. NJUB218 TaxID=2023230 RepID=UPI000F4C9FAC|nr:methionyl-tRNA formyltransferase [Pusillimonas sp. NJUB218]ROT44911.1 methionyl-tRNA formyltransferase [Pusillimonas sp. NJUB218]